MSTQHDQSAEVPQWLHAFKQDPRKALVEALSGGYYFDNLNAVDPERLIHEWAESEELLVSVLDATLAELIPELWGLTSVEFASHVNADASYALNVQREFWRRVFALLAWNKASLLQSRAALVQRTAFLDAQLSLVTLQQFLATS